MDFLLAKPILELALVVLIKFIIINFNFDIIVL